MKTKQGFVLSSALTTNDVRFGLNYFYVIR